MVSNVYLDVASPGFPDGRSCSENIVEMVDMDEENFAISRWVFSTWFEAQVES